MNSGNLFSHGKLLLTAEYAVLDGALSLAVPTISGQEFKFSSIDDNNSQVVWKAYHQGKLWLEAIFDYKNWKIVRSNLLHSADFLLQILQEIQKKSNLRFQSSETYFIETDLQFPSNYGWGSSSTLINNLAEWSQIDAFELNETFFKGSGYDIAVAQKGSPILYQNKPNRFIEKVDFKPEFSSDLILIHLNQKKNSREAIAQYRSQEKSEVLIDSLSEITRNVLKSKGLEEFSNLMKMHENVLSEFLKIPTIKEKLFPDYGGFVKSLGAWEGDFVLASKFGDYESYFKHRNFNTIFDYDSIVI